MRVDTSCGVKVKVVIPGMGNNVDCDINWKVDADGFAQGFLEMEEDVEVSRHTEDGQTEDEDGQTEDEGDKFYFSGSKFRREEVDFFSLNGVVLVTVPFKNDLSKDCDHSAFHSANSRVQFTDDDKGDDSSD